MNKFDRITALLIHLQSKRFVTAQELSDRFEVSQRTIYRDIESLCNAGVPIVGETGIGYSMMEGYRLPPIMFNQEEAISLLMAEKIISKYADKETIRNYNSALFKIKSVLRSSEKQTVEEIENRIRVINNAAYNSTLDKVLPLLIRSITEKEMLQISYLRIDPNKTNIEIIEPIGIFNENGIWNTVAYSIENKNYKKYRIDRILEGKLCSKVFSKEHVSLAEYLGKQKKSEPKYYPKISVQKKVASYISEQKYAYGFIREIEKGDLVEMTFETSCLQTFSRWFLTISDNATLVEPLELKELFLQIVSDISKKLHQS